MYINASPPEKKALKLIELSYKQRGYAPTLSELGKQLGHSKGYAYILCKGLKKKGYIQIDPGPRAIRILDRGKKSRVSAAGNKRRDRQNA